MDTPKCEQFARLAIRARLVDDAQLAEARALVASGRARTIAEALAARGAISEPQRGVLESLADDAVGLQPTEADGDQARPAGPEETVDLAPTSLPIEESVTVDLGSAEPIVYSGPTLFRPDADGATYHPRVQVFSPGPSPVGETRGQFTLSHVHAKGGIGQVWLAYDPQVGREVALKELRSEFARNDMVKARFIREARITGQLEHPGIVPVYSLATAARTAESFYTMRFIRGRTLSQAIREYHDRRAAGPDDRMRQVALLRAFASACQAVAFAHNRGVIHRDLKGDNIALGDFGEVMVLDWGLARVDSDPPEPGDEAGATSPGRPLDTEAFQTQEGQVLGTPAYMPPEQADGRLDQVDHRSDIYSLGVILYQILTGQAPFTGLSTMDLLQKVRTQQPPAPRQIRAAVPRALEAICLKAIRRDRDARYQSAADLAEDVVRFLADEPVSVFREPLTVRLARWGRRHRTAVAVSGALLVSAVVALGLSTYLIGLERNEARDQREQARRAVDEMYTEVADKWLEDHLDRLQRTFLDRALTYYERFAGEDAADPRVRQERARAYLRVGDIRRKLGRTDQARTAYDAALGLLETLAGQQPRNTEVRFDLGVAQARLGLLLFALRDNAGAEASLLRAANIHEALTRQIPGSSKYRYQLARDLKGLADVRKLLGDAAQAEADYRRAIELIEPLTEGPADATAEPRADLAVSLDDLGNLLAEQRRDSEAEAAYLRSIELYGALVAGAPTMPALREGRAKVTNNLAILRLNAGEDARAEEALIKAQADYLRLAEDFPTRPDYRRTLARSHLNRAVLEQKGGRTAQAEDSYRRSAGLYEPLIAENPEIPQYRQDLATGLSNLGALLDARGDFAAAEPAHRRAIDLRDELRRRSPQVPEIRRDLAASLINLGQNLLRQRKGDEAKAAYERAVELGERLVEEFPTVPDYRLTLARAENNLGSLHDGQDRLEEAERHYRKAIALYAGLDAEFPGTPDYRASMAETLNNIGQLNREGAQDDLRRAIEIGRGLTREYPATPAYARVLAIAHANLGFILQAEGRDADALGSFRQAAEAAEGLLTGSTGTPLDADRAGLFLGLAARTARKLDRLAEAKDALLRSVAIQRKVLADEPARAGSRTALRDALGELIEVALAEGDHGSASARLDELLGVDPASGDGRYRAASVAARCAGLAGGDPKLEAGAREAKARDYADRAVALLREAVGAGDPALAGLKDDPAFAAIRGRDDVQELIRRLPTPPPGP